MKNVLIQENKKARFDYSVEESIECGIELVSYEIKSISAGNLNLKTSFAKIVKNEVFIFDMHVKRLESAVQYLKIEEYRPRKLLLHKKQIQKLKETIQKNQGYTLVPLSIYFNDSGKCKVQLGLCKGKKLHDKRASLKEKDLKRESQREKF